MSLTHWKKTCNPNYLGSWDLDNGKGGFDDLILTIKDIRQEEVLNTETNKKEIETVCYFQEDYKPMILNATNKQAISKSTDSPYIERWAGHKIKIKVEKVKAFGGIWDALRVSSIPVKIEMAKCECCGKEIPLNIFNGTKAKCGYGVCSAECRDKMLERAKGEQSNAEM